MQCMRTPRPRPNWRALVRLQGLVYNELPRLPGYSYWAGDERYAAMRTADIDALVVASEAIFAMLIKAGDYIAERPDFMRRMGIPDWAIPMVLKTWEDDPVVSVLATTDWAFGGVDHPDPAYRTPRLYEINADAAGGLPETGYVQWEWLRQTNTGIDQYNLIGPRLIEAWRRNGQVLKQRLGHKPDIYFAYSRLDESGEDMMNTLYIADMCQQAGLTVHVVQIEDIALGEDGRFYDQSGAHIEVCFKFYPWEMIIQDEFGKAAFDDMASAGGTIWIEPPWKMLWNKAVLVALWELYGSDPDKNRYLIPTYFDGEQPSEWRDYVRKPVNGHQGSNILMMRDGKIIHETGGEYSNGPFVVQQLVLPPQFSCDDERNPYWLCKVFVVDGQASGLGILETDSPVTDDDSHLIPHCVVGSERTFSPTDAPYVPIQDTVTTVYVPQDTASKPTDIPPTRGSIPETRRET